MPKHSDEDEQLLHDLENGEGATESDLLHKNSRGIAKLIRYSLIHKYRLDLHDKLFFLLFAAIVGYGIANKV